MGEPTICLCENKGADQLRGDREADKRVCFRYTGSTLPPPPGDYSHIKAVRVPVCAAVKPPFF